MWVCGCLSEWCSHLLFSFHFCCVLQQPYSDTYNTCTHRDTHIGHKTHAVFVCVCVLGRGLLTATHVPMTGVDHHPHIHTQYPHTHTRSFLPLLSLSSHTNTHTRTHNTHRAMSRFLLLVALVLAAVFATLSNVSTSLCVCVCVCM